MSLLSIYLLPDAIIPQGVATNKSPPCPPVPRHPPPLLPTQTPLPHISFYPIPPSQPWSTPIPISIHLTHIHPLCQILTLPPPSLIFLPHLSISIFVYPYPYLHPTHSYTPSLSDSHSPPSLTYLSTPSLVDTKIFLCISYRIKIYKLKKKWEDEGRK